MNKGIELSQGTQLDDILRRALDLGSSEIPVLSPHGEVENIRLEAKNKGDFIEVLIDLHGTSYDLSEMGKKACAEVPKLGEEKSQLTELVCEEQLIRAVIPRSNSAYWIFSLIKVLSNRDHVTRVIL